jgi:hypothetical protein
MKRFLFACTAFLALWCVAAKEHVPPDRLDEWVAYYYLDPHPDEVADALKAVSAQGLFDNDDAQAPLSGFFAEVFKANPARLEEWVKPYIGIPNRGILYSALWMANSKESRAALEQLAKGAAPDEAKQLRALIASPAPDVASMEIDSPASLDYLWGCFMATGSEAPVLRVIDQFKLADAEGDIAAKAIGGAARWSVAANSRQHEKVLAIVKTRAETADPETKARLQEILARIDAEKAHK